MAEDEGREVDSEWGSGGGLCLAGIDSGPEMEGLTDAWGTPQSVHTLAAVGLNPGGLRKLHTSHSHDPDTSGSAGDMGLTLEVETSGLETGGMGNG